MSLFLRNSARLASIAAFALVAGCAQQGPQQAVAVVVPYNPPGTALAALPAAGVTWYHITFATNSFQIDAAGQQAINTAAASMQNNTALTATLVGKTDSVGRDASNMHLSQQRASAVRTALLNTGMVPAQRIEIRWTGDRPQNGQTASDVADARNRAVDIGVH